MRKKPPSQIKYEENHPAITFRMTKEEKEKIMQMAEENKCSISKLVRMALLRLEKDFSKACSDVYTNAWNEAMNQGLAAGYGNGYKKAVQDWAIRVNCWKCKQPILIEPNSENHKNIIRRTEGDISHKPECPRE